MQIEQQEAQPCEQMVQECPQQADQHQLQERMGDGIAIAHVVLGRGQAGLQQPQQQRQKQEQAETAYPMEDGDQPGNGTA